LRQSVEEAVSLHPLGLLEPVLKDQIALLFGAEHHIARARAEAIGVGAGSANEEVGPPVTVDIPKPAHRAARVIMSRHPAELKAVRAVQGGEFHYLAPGVGRAAQGSEYGGGEQSAAAGDVTRVQGMGISLELLFVRGACPFSKQNGRSVKKIKIPLLPPLRKGDRGGFPAPRWGIYA
jgi:hypothetical protein